MSCRTVVCDDDSWMVSHCCLRMMVFQWLLFERVCLFFSLSGVFFLLWWASFLSLCQNSNQAAAVVWNFRKRFNTRNCRFSCYRCGHHFKQHEWVVFMSHVNAQAICVSWCKSRSYSAIAQVLSSTLPSHWSDWSFLLIVALQECWKATIISVPWTNMAVTYVT